MLKILLLLLIIGELIMDERYLTITLRSDWKSELRLAAKMGSHIQYQGEVLNFETPTQFFGQLTEKRWELIRLSQGKEPMTIRALAKLVNRDIKRVHEDIVILTHLGLFERVEKEGIVFPFKSVHIDMHLQAA